MRTRLYDKMKRTLRIWLARKLPDCQETVEKISQSMERSLTVPESIKLKLHLWICVFCQRYRQQLQLIRDAARAKANEASDLVEGVTLSHEARERVRRSLTNQN